MIGVLIPTLDTDVFAKQVGALQALAARRGITVLIGCSNYDADQALSQVRTMLARGVEALAIVGEAHRPELFEIVQARGIPYVVTYSFREGIPHPCVGFDNAAAFEAIAGHLIGLGHRVFGLIHQPARNNDRVVARLEGLRRALAREGLALRPQHVREGPATIEFGAESLNAIRAAESPRPTAVMCGNDTLAIGALAGARQLGVAVPEALSVTGFDDGRMAAYVDPPLTTVFVDNDEIGRRAAEYLLSKLDGKEIASVCQIPTTLIIRSSTGSAGKKSSWLAAGIADKK